MPNLDDLPGGGPPPSPELIRGDVGQLAITYIFNGRTCRADPDDAYFDTDVAQRNGRKQAVIEQHPGTLLAANYQQDLEPPAPPRGP